MRLWPSRDARIPFFEPGINTELIPMRYLCTSCLPKDLGFRRDLQPHRFGRVKSKGYRLVESHSPIGPIFIMEAALAALIRIQPQSIAQLAEQVGLQKSNLLAAMAGKRSLPERAQGTLLKIMGLDRNGALSVHHLYSWKMRDVRHFGPLIADGLLGAVTLYGMRPLGRSQALKPEYWLLQADSSILAIVRAPQDVLGEAAIPGMTISSEVIDTPEPAQWWSEGAPRAVVMVMLEQLKTRIAQPPVSWDQVRTEAERRRVSPEKLMAYLLEI